LHEVARAAGTAVQVAVLGRVGVAAAAGGARGGLDAGGDRPENRVEALDRRIRPADHQAVAAVETEDAAARPAVDVVDASLGELLSPANVVAVVGVAAVDDHVAG